MALANLYAASFNVNDRTPYGPRTIARSFLDLGCNDTSHIANLSSLIIGKYG